MATKVTTAKEEIYGISPVPIDPDDLPDRIPIEMRQLSTIEQLTYFLKLHLGVVVEDVSVMIQLSNIPIRYDPLNRRLFVAPDIYIAFDVDAAMIRERTSYNIWEAGKPPDFALEVASPSTYRNDLYEKRGVYERIGIGEYWLFDPTGGELYGRALTGYRLSNGIYAPIEIVPNEHGLESGYSEVLRLRLCSLERERISELEGVQRDLFLRDDYNAVQLLAQYPESGEYMLTDIGQLARSQRLEAELDAERTQREQVESERDDERSQREQVESERDADRAEIVRLRERLRRMGLD